MKDGVISEGMGERCRGKIKEKKKERICIKGQKEDLNILGQI